MVEQTVPADSVSALRESALAAAGVRGIFTNLIDGKSVGARNTLDVLDPATGELLAKVPDIERDGMDAAFAAARRAFSSWSKLTWEARRSILEKAFENVKAHREELVTLLMAEGGGAREAWPCGKSRLFWMTSRRAFSRKAFPTWKPPNRALAGSPGTMRPSASSRRSVPGISRFFCRTTR